MMERDWDDHIGLGKTAFCGICRVLRLDLLMLLLMVLRADMASKIPIPVNKYDLWTRGQSDWHIVLPKTLIKIH